MSETGHHQGVIAMAASYEYATVEDILEEAKEKGEAPFIFVLDNIEDPHNLGAMIRTANLAGAHGVIIPKRRAVGLTSTVARTSAGAINYTPVAKVTNLKQTMEQLKKEGMWFVCADMDGTPYYQMDLKGPMGLVIGNEGEGVSRLIKETCDFVASIPMKGDIDSLNASVAAGFWLSRSPVSGGNRGENRMKDYTEYTDEELVDLLRQGETEVMDYLLEKYKFIVRQKARVLYLAGGEADDLIQEGMIGLFKAIRDYRGDKEASLYVCSVMCGQTDV